MQIMVLVPDEIATLQALGVRLRASRLDSGQSQQLFAERIGVSVPTLRAMERGAPTVQVVSWVRALWALGRLHELAEVLAPAGSLFDQAERQRAQHLRRRASPRRRG
jgi:transcriptional regulator with XRE-family HTH domain